MKKVLMLSFLALSGVAHANVDEFGFAAKYQQYKNEFDRGSRIALASVNEDLQPGKVWMCHIASMQSGRPSPIGGSYVFGVRVGAIEQPFETSYDLMPVYVSFGLLNPRNVQVITHRTGINSGQLFYNNREYMTVSETDSGLTGFDRRESMIVRKHGDKVMIRLHPYRDESAPRVGEYKRFYSCQRFE